MDYEDDWYDWPNEDEYDKYWDDYDLEEDFDDTHGNWGYVPFVYMGLQEDQSYQPDF